MYEYQQIVYRLRSGESQRSIARSRLVSRKKLREVFEISKKLGWLDKKGMPNADALSAAFCMKDPLRDSKLEPYKGLIGPLLERGFSTRVIHQYLIEEHSFAGSYSCVQRYTKHLLKISPKNLTVPLNFKAGEAAQVDFGQGPVLLDQRSNKQVRTWFFVMTLCFSRHQYVELVRHQDVETWLHCHKNAFEWFGGVPKKVIIDNPKCAIIKASSREPEVQRSYEELAQSYGFIIHACPPRDPQKKGRVESGVKYVKRNFLPLRQLGSLQEGNKQLKEWILEKAGHRIHGTTRERPLDRFVEVEQAALKPLPSDPIEICTWHKARLYRDCHIRFDYGRYSAPYRYANQVLWLKVTPTTVSIYADHRCLTTHARTFDPDKPRTRIEHLPANTRAFFSQDAVWCQEQAERIGEHCLIVVETLLTDPVRDLLRAAQSVIRLARKYNRARVESACRRAVLFHSINLSTIQEILKKGLDYEPIVSEISCDPLGNVYQGLAIYQRQSFSSDVSGGA